jgi:hypothetical protein
MKTRIITARLDKELNQEIQFLKSSLKLASTTSVLAEAIHMLYAITKKKQSEKSSLQLFEESGLLGCMEGTADLSTTYKDEISKMLKQKHGTKNIKSKKSRGSRERNS